jgi:hypothetical protein
MNSLSPKDLIKDPSGPPARNDNRSYVSQTQNGGHVKDSSESSPKSRDSPNAARLCLARSHSGRELCKELSVTPRSASSKEPGPVLCRSQSGKDIVSARHQSGTELSARSVSGKQLTEAGSHFRPLMGPTRRVLLSDRLGLSPSTGTIGSSDKEVSAYA